MYNQCCCYRHFHHQDLADANELNVKWLLKKQREIIQNVINLIVIYLWSVLTLHYAMSELFTH